MNLLKSIVGFAVVAPLFVSAQTMTVALENGGCVGVTEVAPKVVRVDHLAQGQSAYATGNVVALPAVKSIGNEFVAGSRRGFTTRGGVVVMVDSVTGDVVIDAGMPRVIGSSRVGDEIRIATMGRQSWHGGGERGYSFDLAGDTLVMYNRQNYGYVKGDTRIKQMNITIPFVVSSAGYGLFFDDFSASSLSLGEGNLVYTSEGSKPVSYYFLGSGSMPEVVYDFTALVGRQELPPLWSLGYITSKYGYRTQKETLGVVDTLRREGYPVDGVVLDLYWYGKEQDMGRLEWDKDQWPDHVSMLKALKRKGVNTVIISQPYVLRNGRGLDNFNSLSERGLFVRDSIGGVQDVKIWVGEGGMFDVANPDTRAWLTERYRQLTDEGVGGWWGDLGEPEVHPETGFHANGLPARLYHNQYGNDWSRIIYDLFKKEYPDRRLMTLMRGGTAGLQRYSVFPWSTDVSRSWGGLQPQVAIMLNSGLSGLGYMSHDVGGFAIDEERPYDPELYVRWLQLGLFSPVLRTHSQRFAEPYLYPEQADIILPLIKERYKWLPYNYTMAFENARYGLPLVRPIDFYSEDASRHADIEDQYLWGRDMMVAPVLEEGARQRRVVFPEGQWLDYANPKKVYSLGDTITYPASLATIPLFVRAGAFIVKSDYPMNNTGDYRNDRFTVEYFPVPGVDSETMVYLDDLKSPDSIKKLDYALMKFTGRYEGDSINICAELEGDFPGMPQNINLTFKIHNIANREHAQRLAKYIKKWHYDPATRVLSFDVKWNVSHPLYLLN